MGLTVSNARAAIDWRPFLRGFAEEIDSVNAPDARDGMLRGIGRRVARMMPLPPAQTLAGLEIEINDALETIGWGQVRMTVLAEERQLLIEHRDLPRIGALGTPPGHWLAALLEGMYDGWLAQQPGHSPALSARRRPGPTPGVVLLHYGRQS